MGTVPNLQVIQELEENIPKGFASTARERERVLNERKELMKQKAKAAFLRKKAQLAQNQSSGTKPIVSEEESSFRSEQEPPTKFEEPEKIEIKQEEEEAIPSFSLNDSVEIRRKRALAAAERRRRSSG